MNPEDLLTDAFRDRTEHTDYPSTPLSAVAARAGAIRARRRRTTILAAAATVAVVVIPFGVVQAGGWFFHTSQPAPTKVHPNDNRTTSQPTVQNSTDPLSLDGLPAGRKPGIDYLVGDTYVTKNGDRITRPLLTKAVAATPVPGGILVSTASQLSGMGDLVLETDSGDQRLGCGSDRFAMSTDGTESAYWVMDSCTAGSAGKLYSGVNNTMGESGAGYVATPAGSVYEPIGIVRQGTVVNVTKGNTRHSEIVDASGTGSPIPGLAFAGGSDENNDVVSGQIAGDSETGIVVHASTGVPVAYFPSWTMGQFSPSGRYVFGFRQTSGPGSWAVFDASTGKEVSTLPALDAEVSQVAWDQDGTLLMTVTNGSSAAVVRFDMNDDVTLALPERAHQGAGMAYRLATRP